jgi:hypothetical protein
MPESLSLATLTLIVAVFAPAATYFWAKVFPDTLGKLVLGAVERSNNERLARLKDELERHTSLRVETVKAELQATYSTLQTSVDYLAAGQSGMREETITAVKELWTAMLGLKADFGLAITFEMLFTPDEIRKGIAAAVKPKFMGFLDSVREESALHEKAQRYTGGEVEAARLFCGDRLWLLFYVFRAVYIRTCFLANRSLTQKRYEGWRDDAMIPWMLAGVVSADELRRAREDHAYGLHSAVSIVEARFLHEATRVMSGSKAMSDTLSDMQAFLLVHTKSVSEQRAAQGVPPV